MKKRMLAILLTLCTILTLLPFGASAAGFQDVKPEHLQALRGRHLPVACLRRGEDDGGEPLRRREDDGLFL